MTRIRFNPKFEEITGIALMIRAALLITLVSSGISGAGAALAEESGEEWGPPNLLKTLKTPFNSTGAETGEKPTGDDPLGLSSISLTGTRSLPRANSSLKAKLIPSQMFLPERMTIGQATAFTVKGRPGSWVAIAMADRNSGAKPIVGQNLRLGPDRKVVALGKIPASGLAEIFVETPIEGDLIGQYLYFEAAIWSKTDMSDTEVAQTVSVVKAAPENGVEVAQQSLEKKRGVRFVPDSAVPLTQRQTGASLSTGLP